MNLPQMRNALTVPRFTGLAAALELAERLAAAPAWTISTIKTALARFPLQLDTMLAWEADTQSVMVRSEDFAEGIKAFMEKRAPAFKGQRGTP
jgi:2-(1,2-epoxy-1,2-dihydrophenyl)acetyl-CoA isomerase